MSKKFLFSFILIVLLWSTNCLAGVMMQAFYWDPPSGGVWYDHVKSKADSLKKVGFTAIWLPSPVKGMSGGYSMGYDPFDLYDLGEYNQQGTVETRFGSKSELKSCVSAYRDKGMEVYLDIVINHMAGGQLQYNPNTGTNTWTKFDYVHNTFERGYNDFHPSTYWTSDEGVFGGYPDVCHRNPYVHNGIITWGNWLVSELGVTGWRFDYVKGFGGWMVKDFIQGTGNLFTVGEYWDTNFGLLDAWINDTGGLASVFDFALYYTLKDMCNNTSGTFNMRYLDHAGYVGANPFKSVTFCDNHDTDHEGGIISDKMMAYAYILTAEGYPCVFWKDYFVYKLGDKIAPLVSAHEKYAGGSTTNLWKDDDLYIAQRNGYGNIPGLVVAINDNPSTDRTQSVQTKWKNTTLKEKSGKGGNYTTDANGWVSLTVPRRGYIVVAPDSGTTDTTKVAVTFTVTNVRSERTNTVYVVGNCSELGNWNYSNAVALTLVDSITWRTGYPIELPKGQSIEYKYIRKNNCNVIEELGANHTYIVPTSGTGSVNDTWNQQGIPVKFTVTNNKTSLGQEVYVVGNCPELGNWNTSKARGPFDCPNWPIWTTTHPIYLPAGQSIKYKYILKDHNNSCVIVDTTKSFNYNVPTTGSGSVVNDWGGVVDSSFVMDGNVDASARLVSSNSGLDLYVGWNGKQLYVATQHASTQSADMFIFVSDTRGALKSAPWAKSGQVATWGAMLCNESTNNWAGWQDVNPSTKTATITQSAKPYLEGTIEVNTEFTSPTKIYIAVGKYATPDGGALSNQVPAGNGDGNIDPEELYEFNLTTTEVKTVKDSKDKSNAFSLAQNYPNPFSLGTTITYSIPTAGNVTIFIYNTNGQLVRRLIARFQEAGQYTFYWDGRNDRGRPVPSGTYIYKLTKDGELFATKSMVLIK